MSSLTLPGLHRRAADDVADRERHRSPASPRAGRTERAAAPAAAPRTAAGRLDRGPLVHRLPMFVMILCGKRQCFMCACLIRATSPETPRHPRSVRQTGSACRARMSRRGQGRPRDNNDGMMVAALRRRGVDHAAAATDPRTSGCRPRKVGGEVALETLLREMGRLWQSRHVLARLTTMRAATRRIAWRARQRLRNGVADDRVGPQCGCAAPGAGAARAGEAQMPREWRPIIRTSRR